MRSVVVVSCKRIDKFSEQVYVDLRLKSSLQKFYDHYHELIRVAGESFVICLCWAWGGGGGGGGGEKIYYIAIFPPIQVRGKYGYGGKMAL
jgi:hypothetical protein